MWLARPYPVAQLSRVHAALHAAVADDLLPLMATYVQAAKALAELDPDEAQDWTRLHPDRVGLVRATSEVAEAWEGIVVLGASLTDPLVFRSFVWSAVAARFLEQAPSKVALQRYRQGAPLPGTSAEDSALYAALPALIGLGPDLPDEISGPSPLPGQPVATLLGLPDTDYRGIDPLDGTAISAEDCRAHFAAAPAPWRDILGRATGQGLLLRPA